MSDTAALVPVPFHAPARPRAGDTGRFSNSGTSARRLAPVGHLEQPVASKADASLVYDPSGSCVAESRLGWIVNIWI